MNPTTLNNEFIRNIFEGYLAYMTPHDTDSNDRIRLRELYTRMRSIITYHDMNLPATYDRVIALKNEADAIEAEMNAARWANAIPVVRQEVHSDNSSHPIFDSLQDEPSSEWNIEYCGKTYAVDSAMTYSAVQLKIMFDSEFQQVECARISGPRIVGAEHAEYNECIAKRRDMDFRVKQLVGEDLYKALYTCVVCNKDLSDEELDNKAFDMYYEPSGPSHGYCSMCNECQAQENQQNSGEDMDM